MYLRIGWVPMSEEAPYYIEVANNAHDGAHDGHIGEGTQECPEPHGSLVILVGEGIAQADSAR